MKPLIILSCLLLLIVPVLAATGVIELPKYPQAQQALTEYQIACKNAKLNYELALKKAAKDCQGKLDDALKLAMKNNNLDEANRITRAKNNLPETKQESRLPNGIKAVARRSDGRDTMLIILYNDGRIDWGGKHNFAAWNAKGTTMTFVFKDHPDWWDRHVIAGDGMSMKGENGFQMPLRVDVILGNLR